MAMKVEIDAEENNLLEKEIKVLIEVRLVCKNIK
jgi:hypothetical protein